MVTAVNVNAIARSNARVKRGKRGAVFSERLMSSTDARTAVSLSGLKVIPVAVVVSSAYDQI